MPKKRYQVLLITHVAAEKAGTIKDHVHELTYGLDADVVKIDCRLASRLDIEAFDVVILHYSLVISSPNYVSPALATKLNAFSGLCILFIQDEYRWIDRTAEAMRQLSVDVVFSLLSSDVVRQVYHHPWCNQIRFERTLTGFVPEHLVALPVPPYESRKFDVGYRARKLPTWYGRHSEQKWRIAERFVKDAHRFGLKVDIATDEASRLYGKAWIDFLSNCRAVLGTESGASVCDFTGEIQAKVEGHITDNPNVTQEELYNLYVRDLDGIIVMNAISPRCFEAAALRTLMIMYPGEYNGILKPGRHYVLLQNDHSNMEEVVAILRSPELARPIIESAYNEVAMSGNWSHAALAAHVDRVIREEAAPPSARGLLPWEVALVKLGSYFAAMRERTIFWILPSALTFASFVRQGIDRLPPNMRKLVLPLARAIWRGMSLIAKRLLQKP